MSRPPITVGPDRRAFRRQLDDALDWLEANSGGGGGGGATNLTYTASTRLLESSTGTDVTLPLAGANPGLMSAADKTKLDGIAAGATANATDAALRDRATHTGTQAAATITGLATVATSGSASDLGAGTLPAARFDDTAHGARAGGTLHADATPSVAGFMSAADKAKLDGVAAGANAYVHPNHTGDVTSTGDGATVIANGVVTNAKLSSMAQATIKGRAAGQGTGDPTNLTAAQVTEIVNTFTASLKGLAPASGGGTTNFLRADGTWAAPPGGGAGTDLSYTAATRLLESSTGADVTLPFVTSTDAGLAPASGGGTTNFLRADGTWAAPSGGGGGATYAYCQLTSNYTLDNSTLEQKLFNATANGALTLATGRYRFHCVLYILSMSATSGNGSFRLLGGGTATLANVIYQVVGTDNTGPLSAGAATRAAAIGSSSPGSMVTAGTGTGLFVDIDGMFNVTAAGTIIPSIALVTAAAAVVQAGSYFECIRIGDTGANTQGSWS